MFSRSLLTSARSERRGMVFVCPFSLEVFLFLGRKRTSRNAFGVFEELKELLIPFTIKLRKSCPPPSAWNHNANHSRKDVKRNGLKGGLTTTIVLLFNLAWSVIHRHKLITVHLRRTVTSTMVVKRSVHTYYKF